jgi:hypothetical protein
MEVYVLSYLRPMPDGRWTGMFVGAYTSARKVEEAQERLRGRPGFRDFPEGFRVHCYRADQDYDDPMFFTAWNPA